MNKKRIGISCKNGNWLEEIDRVDTMRFQHIELNIYNADFNAKMFDVNYLDQVKKKLREKKLSVSVHTIEGTNLAEKVNRIRYASVNILRDTLEMADYIDAEWVVVHVGNAGFSCADKEKRKERGEIAAQSIREVLGRDLDCRPMIALENMYRYSPEQKKCKIGSDIEEFELLFRRINSDKVGLLYDMGHNHICYGDSDYRKHFLDVFRDKVIAVHIHYNDGIEDLHYGLQKYDLSSYQKELDMIAKLKNEVCLVCESYTLEENIANQEVLRRYLL